MRSDVVNRHKRFQLGVIAGLHGFSPSNMKNMRIFFEEWASQLEPNRQLTADLEELKIMAVFSR